LWYIDLKEKDYSYYCPKSSQYTKKACGGMRTTQRIVKNTVLELKSEIPADMPLDSDNTKANLLR
jgi:hypothetical protein